VDIRFYAMLRPIVGGKMVSLDLPDGSTARDVLETVGKRYPEIDRLIWDANGGLGDYIKVFVDGREIRYLQNLDTVVPPNAEVDVFPPAAGG
jgi:molybdopterin synthase sulfur carrier subunit